MKTKDYEKRLESLKAKFSGWKSHYQELSQYINPHMGRFEAAKDKGDKKQIKIYDNTATVALRVLSAGMHAGMSSPSRQWFKLSTSDQALDDLAEVKAWLHEVQRRVRYVLSNSNFYKAIHNSYGELGLFGTACTLMLEDDVDVIRCYSFTAGEYLLAVNGRGVVDTMYREFAMTIHEAATRFGVDNLTEQSRRLHEKGDLDETIIIVHAIQPRKDYDPDKKDNKNMPFESVYFEKGAKTFLKESGFEENAILAPRWENVSGEAYGRSPAMEALGDVKQLQHQQLAKGKAISKQVDPALQAPIELQTTGVDSIPNGINYVSNTQQGIRPAYDVNLNLSYLLADIQDVRQRINTSFYKDLFMMLADSDRRQITAREIEERHTEKMLMLGPVLENIGSDQLDVAIERVFGIMSRKGLIPEAPEALQGRPLKIEYVSTLAQAQKAVGVGAIEQLVMSVGQMAQFKPEVLDKLNADEAVDQIAEMLGTNPNLVIDDETVAQLRAQRQQAMAQQQQMEMMSQGASAAQTLSNTDTESDNALTQIIKQSSAL